MHGGPASDVTNRAVAMAFQDQGGDDVVGSELDGQMQRGKEPVVRLGIDFGCIGEQQQADNVQIATTHTSMQQGFTAGGSGVQIHHGGIQDSSNLILHHIRQRTVHVFTGNEIEEKNGPDLICFGMALRLHQPMDLIDGVIGVACIVGIVGGWLVAMGEAAQATQEEEQALQVH